MAASSPKLYIGVDGGGTSTTAISLSASGSTLGTAVSGSTNFNSVGREKAKTHLHDVLRLAVAAVPAATLADVASVCLGVSGCNTDADARMLVGWVQELFPSSLSLQPPYPVITSYNDSIAALASGTRGELHGVVVIAGTGQMAKGFNRHAAAAADPSVPSEWTAGGNGCLIDDGSGFGIALDALRAAFQAADEMGPPTAMLPDVLSHVKGSDATAIVPWLYDDFSWGHVATVAPIALKQAAASPPDAVALAIVRRHSQYLIRAAATILRKLQFPASEPVTVVLCGGILEHELMAALVREGVKQQFSNAQFTHPLVDPAHGAALLAINQAKTGRE